MAERSEGTPRKMVGNAAASGVPLCRKCGLPFTAKGLGAHARTCSGNRPSRPLEQTTRCLQGDEDEEVQAGGEREKPFTASPSNKTQGGEQG